MKKFLRKGILIFITLMIVLSMSATVFAESCPSCAYPNLSTVYNPFPTCTQNGVLEHYCTSCGYIAYLEAVPAYGHSYNIPSATCTEDKFCYRCGSVAQYKLGHALQWNPTYHWWECSRCPYRSY